MLGMVSLWLDVPIYFAFPQANVNAQVYRHHVLDAYIRPYASAIGKNFLIMLDRKGIAKQFSAWNGQLKGIHKEVVSLFLIPITRSLLAYNWVTKAMACSSQQTYRSHN